MPDEPTIADQIRSLSEPLQKLRLIQEAMLAAARQIQDVVTFHDHPDMVALDGELDIMYRGQL